MWKHIFGYGNTRFWLRKDTGTMNRSPTPGGMFATNFVGVRNVIAIRLQHFGNLSAAVGDRFIVPAYTYTPTKWQTDMCV